MKLTSRQILSFNANMDAKYAHMGLKINMTDPKTVRISTWGFYYDIPYSEWNIATELLIVSVFNMGRKSAAKEIKLFTDKTFGL